MKKPATERKEKWKRVRQKRKPGASGFKIAPGIEWVLERPATAKQKRKGDYTTVTTLTLDETEPG